MPKKIPEGYSELSLNVPKNLKIRFKVAVAKKETSMSDVIKVLIENWLIDNEET